MKYEIEDYIVYDANSNRIRDRTNKEGYIEHWHPVPEKISDWSLRKCLEKHGSKAAKVVRMYENGVPISEIQKALSISAHCIYKILDYYNVPRRRGRYRKKKRLSPEEIEKIQELWMKGYSVYMIAKLLDRSEHTINRVLRRLGLK